MRSITVVLATLLTLTGCPSSPDADDDDASPGDDDDATPADDDDDDDDDDDATPTDDDDDDDTDDDWPDLPGTFDGMGEYAELAATSDGFLHIAYHDDDAEGVAYARNDGGAWASASVDSGNPDSMAVHCGEPMAFDLDAQDVAHLVYYYNDNHHFPGEAWYATNATGVWERTMIPWIAGCWGEEVEYTIGADAQGAPQIWARWSFSSVFVVSTFEEGAVVQREPEVAVSDTRHASLATAPDGTTYLGLSTDGGGAEERGLYLAVGTGEAVQTEPVDVGLETGTYLRASDIALDATGQVHLAYCHPDEVRYATHASGSWAIQVVDATPCYDQVSIALDDTGHVHIAHIPAGDGEIRYATDISGSWTLESLPIATNEATFATVAATAAGAHVAYRDEITESLRLLSNVSGSWQVETVAAP
jgi:hypothetical protein